MESKKNSKADLRKRSLLFLQLSLIVVLVAAYLAIEWKTYSPEADYQKVSMGDLLPDEEPIVSLEIPATPVVPPPPPLAVDPDIIDDEDPTPEDNIETPESFPDEIVKMDDIKEAPVEEPILVPFEFIEDVPIFPGCEGLQSNDERKQCMSQKITQFVNSRFNKNLGQQVGVSGINKINVAFKIDKEGNIIDVQSRAPHPSLEQEALRVINALPKMEPGKQRGKPVAVSYYLPIIFQVEN
jgi:periplasmic protein TonB